jgi:AcrR family transcriptional regulator
MHFMPSRANSLRDARRAETTSALIHLAREATARRGLSGFTVEELCAEAGVSRRTFFNYFASKEDAVLGMPLERCDGERVERFLAGATAGPSLSPTLLLDLATLVEAQWESLEIAPDRLDELFAAVDKEPRLISRMLQHGREEEERSAELVEQREGLPPGDLRAQAAAQIVGAMSRAAIAEFLSPARTDSFLVIFERRIAAARDLFATQTALMGPSA